MATSATNLEELYARLALEEEAEGGVIIKENEAKPQQPTYVLVGRFLTEKNINFRAMQNVIASLWRPKEGMEIHDIGGHRYSFVFYHVLDMQKVLDGGPWTFEQNLLAYHKLGDNEDPHLVNLHKSDIWVQIYDLPKGLVSESILVSIGNFVGKFVKSDPVNMNGGWRMYVRIRVTLDLDKPLKRRMKIKREGGEWSWINFKYERLSTFCFVCGLLGHSERDCSVVYADPDKEIVRAYGTWLRAPVRGINPQNSGAKWLRNSIEGGTGWSVSGDRRGTESTAYGGGKAADQPMEMDDGLNEILGDNGGIRIIRKGQESEITGNKLSNPPAHDLGGNLLRKEIIITDPKRKRIEEENIVEENVEITSEIGPNLKNGPKNLLEAGLAGQARLQQ